MSYTSKNDMPSTVSAGFRAFGTGNDRAFGSGGSRAFGSGSRTTPSAFGSGDRDMKRAQAAETAAREAAAASAKKIETDKEAKRIADASNFASEEFYPALGGGGAPKPVVKPVAMNFKKTVEVMATRAAAEEAAEQSKTHFALANVNVNVKAKMKVTAKAATEISSWDSCYDDYESEEMPYVSDAGDATEESDSEFNADLGSTRRRGDKGIW